MVKLLTEAAPAKINLFLRVVGRRPDGYHELDSIFLPLGLCDRVHVEMRSGSRRGVALTGNYGDLPSDERNLAVKAAMRFMAEFSIDADVLIGLDKRIPAGAGLGGGSSDAGAVLRMMAALTRINDPARLTRLATAIGADVPFFLDPRPARVGGIGERITPLPAVPAWPIVIAVPPIEVPTATIFSDLAPAEWSGPAPSADVAAFIAGHLPKGLFVNDLEGPAFRRFPSISNLKRVMKDAGALCAAMSGSGGAVFGLFSSAAVADRAAASLRDRDPASCVFTTTVQAQSSSSVSYSDVDN
jgi:4-diphosphocytidyl-2-C-methyl-D-erythritol kinase